MNNKFFRFLVLFMSISLFGIIMVQVYWVRKVLDKSEAQFSLNANQTIVKITEELDKLEMKLYIDSYNYLKNNVGIAEPQEEDFLKIGYYQINPKTNETVIYSNSIIPDNAAINSSFYDKSVDTFKIKSFSAKRKTEIFSGKNQLENNLSDLKPTPEVTIEKKGRLSILDEAQYEIFFRDIAMLKPIELRINSEGLKELLQVELAKSGIPIPFEYAVSTKNNTLTEIKSPNFVRYNEYSYKVPLFKDNENVNQYFLEVSFPTKKNYLYSTIINTMMLSVIFTIIIIVVFVSTINQFLKQRKISQIKTDFINNMTHEFKTPIATINLALDSMKNPKILENRESLLRYLGVIREENKRMNAQVENVLRISKLDKKEINIEKESLDVHDLINDTQDHVALLLEEQKGRMVINTKASRSTVLASDSHFTNVLVNIVENAIKYSVNPPRILITTENVKDLILIKIKDNGIGISKSSQKKIFDKFYREHTGDVHNVKGHGLGLAYVKRIVIAHGGEIFVESEKGVGSTFTIKLPLIIN